MYASVHDFSSDIGVSNPALCTPIYTAVCMCTPLFCSLCRQQRQLYILMTAVSNSVYVQQLRITYNCILQSFEGITKVTVLIALAHLRRRHASEETIQLINLVADMTRSTVLDCRQVVTVLLSQITNFLLLPIVNLAPTN
jgi:uncharacterized membrane protein